jgi:hypothetical protein
MQTRQEIEQELSARLMIANNSTMVSSTRITTLVQDANLWAGTLFFWPSLARSRYFSSKPSIDSSTPILPLNYDYYDYPADFLTGSVSRLYFNGLKYEKKAFQDFLDYVDGTQEPNTAPDRTRRYFAEFGRQFFVWPGVASAGTNDGLVWGNIQPPALPNPTSTTIFSLWNDSGNEAILKKAISVEMERLDPTFANQQKAEAVQLLTVIWNKVTAENQKSQRLNHPRFAVPNFFNLNGFIGGFWNNNSINNP